MEMAAKGANFEGKIQSSGHGESKYYTTKW